jgi:hypothetical protein
MQSGGRVALGCRNGFNETLKMSSEIEFGWKEQAYSSFQQVYASRSAGASPEASLALLKESMPLIVHVRDQGGHAWEKNWRIAQLGWWDKTLFSAKVQADFGQVNFVDCDWPVAEYFLQ